MSPVDFKKWQCPLSFSLNFPVDFKIAQRACRFQEMAMSPVVIFKMFLSLCKGSSMSPNHKL